MPVKAGYKLSSQTTQDILSSGLQYPELLEIEKNLLCTILTIR